MSKVIKIILILTIIFIRSNSFAGSDPDFNAVKGNAKKPTYFVSHNIKGLISSFLAPTSEEIKNYSCCVASESYALKSISIAPDGVITVRYTHYLDGNDHVYETNILSLDSLIENINLGYVVYVDSVEELDFFYAKERVEHNFFRIAIKNKCKNLKKLIFPLKWRGYSSKTYKKALDSIMSNRSVEELRLPLISYDFYSYFEEKAVGRLTNLKHLDISFAKNYHDDFDFTLMLNKLNIKSITIGGNSLSFNFLRDLNKVKSLEKMILVGNVSKEDEKFIEDNLTPLGIKVVVIDR
ncbi:hypothetical protein [Cysteiniphilum sp. JM-1]|uniref:hypothetical protein n=1 Tax=Cysteiniphilum sp. JM-1 TaxID=2610891 RepID=UPI0012471627|nr:hypothetical protein [Cysteiniphilum sp. JM-1]